MLDWKVAELREALRRAILRAFVRWGKLSPEAADTLVGWDIARCGFSLFVGPPVDDRAHLGGLLRYLFRSPISFKRLNYQEKTGKVRLKLKRGGHREWDHALDFLADLSIHVPKARQQIVTYAGYYANSTGNLNRDQETEEESADTVQAPGPGLRRWVPWSTLIARAWKVDPQLCPKCGQKMKRTRPILERLELERLLKSNRNGNAKACLCHRSTHRDEGSPLDSPIGGRVKPLAAAKEKSDVVSELEKVAKSHQVRRKKKNAK